MDDFEFMSSYTACLEMALNKNPVNATGNQPIGTEFVYWTKITEECFERLSQPLIHLPDQIEYTERSGNFYCIENMVPYDEILKQVIYQYINDIEQSTTLKRGEF